jgi:membrane fusion protein (multidrug efflux system)
LKLSPNGRAELAEEKKEKVNRGRRKKIAFLVLSILLLGGAGGVYYYLQYQKTHISTDDAYVDGHVHTIAPKISGTVKAILVKDNQRVKKGEILLEIDPADYEVSLKEAKASLEEERAKLFELQDAVEAARRQLAENLASLKGARADFELQQANLRQNRKDLEREQFLMQKDLVARQEYDRSQTAYEVSEAQVKSARERIRQMEASLETQRAVIRQAEAALPPQRAVIRQKEEELKQAALNKEYTVIRSPAEGYVTKRTVEVGNQVQVAQPLLAVVPLAADQVWITANYKETDLKEVRPGQRVRIKVDTYPGRTFYGRVNSVMAGTGAVFSLFPPENATGNFVKVVQRIPVKITLEEGTDPDHLLRIGMSVVPTILVENP